jgi:hypothetical protein
MTSTSQSQLEHSLFIATPKHIRHHSQRINKTLFECDTHDSIVNARASLDNSSLFAVADSQVVILCDAALGRKKHTLKKGDVRRSNPAPTGLAH